MSWVSTMRPFLIICAHTTVDCTCTTARPSQVPQQAKLYELTSGSAWVWCESAQGFDNALGCSFVAEDGECSAWGTYVDPKSTRFDRVPELGARVCPGSIERAD